MMSAIYFHGVYVTRSWPIRSQRLRSGKYCGEVAGDAQSCFLDAHLNLQVGPMREPLARTSSATERDTTAASGEIRLLPYLGSEILYSPVAAYIGLGSSTSRFPWKRDVDCGSINSLGR